jgi:hypothetical protein
LAFTGQTPFVLNNNILPPLWTDSIRWRHVVIDFPMIAVLYLANGKEKGYRYTPDTINKTVTLTSYRDSIDSYMFKYNEPAKDVLELRGTWKQNSVYIRLQKEDLSQYTIRQKPFWIKPD